MSNNKATRDEEIACIIAERNKLQADCAALREAVERIYISSEASYESANPGYIDLRVTEADMQAARAALSSGAGKTTLKYLTRLEDVADAAKAYFEAKKPDDINETEDDLERSIDALIALGQARTTLCEAVDGFLKSSGQGRRC